MKLKERLRGIATAVAAVALAVTVAPTMGLAAAAPLSAGTATISGLGDNVDNVELYQIATITNGDNNVLVTTPVEAYADILGDNCENFTESNRYEIAAQVEAALTGDATYSVTNSDGSISDGVARFNNVAAGLYLVKVSPRDAGVVYQTVIMKVAPEANVETGAWGVPSGTVTDLKMSENNVETSLTKMVSANGTDGWDSSVDTLDAGDTAYFKVSVELPVYAGITAESNVDFKLVDELPEGLSFRSATASIGEKASYTTDNGIAVSGKTITVTVPASDLAQVAEGDELVLLVNATVDAGQVGKLTNTAHAEWYQSLSDKDPVPTEDRTAVVIVYAANVTKYVGTADQDGIVSVADDAETINGAVFQLQKLNGSNWENVSDELSANPTTTNVTSLGAGTYRWVELVAPAGYQCHGAGEQFTINDTAAPESANYTIASKYGDLKDDFVSELPETGGTGTVALTVVGVGLMAGAAYLVVRSRKEN